MEFKFEVIQPVNAYFVNNLIIEADSYEEAENIVKGLNIKDFDEYLEDEAWDLIDTGTDGDLEIYYGTEFIK